MTPAPIDSVCHHLSSSIADLTIEHSQEGEASEEMGCASYGFCAICLEQIDIKETALVKGCEHAYCLTCILRWASYKEKTTCPQCKHPFESLVVHRALDGSIQAYMQEESVCLLLRAKWFEPLVVKSPEEPHDELEDLHVYGYDSDLGDEDDIDESYYHSSTIRIGNRRWGDNGYVRNGRQEARPVYHSNNNTASSSGSPRERKQKQPVEPVAGRRAKRALKREAADKAAAVKHQLHLERLGRK